MRLSPPDLEMRFVRTSGPLHAGLLNPLARFRRYGGGIGQAGRLFLGGRHVPIRIVPARGVNRRVDGAAVSQPPGDTTSAWESAAPREHPYRLNIESPAFPPLKIYASRSCSSSGFSELIRPGGIIETLNGFRDFTSEALTLVLSSGANGLAMTNSAPSSSPTTRPISGSSPARPICSVRSAE